MKYFTIIIFFFTAFCNAQDEFEDYVKVTAYKIIEEYDDGPCSIIRYLKDEGLGNFVKAVETDDVPFTKKLIALKKEAKKKWPQHDVWCSDHCIGCPTVDKMFIIEFNKYRDTILLMEDRYLYSPGDKKMFSDEKGALSKILPEQIKDFFKHDFEEEIEKSYSERDSIPPTTITYKNLKLYNCKRKAFEKQFGVFHLIVTTIDSSFTGMHTSNSYYYNSMNFSIDEKSGLIDNVQLNFPDHSGNGYGDEYDLSVDGIRGGDREEKIFAKFPLSTKHKRYNSKRMTLAEMDDDYYYEIKISGNRGIVSFRIKQHLIKEIEVEFNYPSD